MIIIERCCKNKDEAQALANFLWNEIERHLDNVVQIENDLGVLYKKWDVRASHERQFVKP